MRRVLVVLLAVACVLGALALAVLGYPVAALALAVLSAAFAAMRLTAGRAARRGVPQQPGLGAQTDHLVEVYQVNSAPGEEEMERFMYAQCGEAGCEFLEFADAGADDEEANLRGK